MHIAWVVICPPPLYPQMPLRSVRRGRRPARLRTRGELRRSQSLKSLRVRSDFGCWRGGRGCSRSHDLVEGLAVAHHAEFATRAFLQRGEAHFQISHFREQLTIALTLLRVGGALRVGRGAQAPYLAQPPVGNPYPVFQQGQEKDQYESENSHEDRSL